MSFANDSLEANLYHFYKQIFPIERKWKIGWKSANCSVLQRDMTGHDRTKMKIFSRFYKWSLTSGQKMRKCNVAYLRPIWSQAQSRPTPLVPPTFVIQKIKIPARRMPLYWKFIISNIFKYLLLIWKKKSQKRFKEILVYSHFILIYFRKSDITFWKDIQKPDWYTDPSF